MKITNLGKDATIKEIRRAMRHMSTEGELETIILEGFGQIRKTGCGSDPYALGPLPEYDDTDLMVDYDAFTYGWKESWVLERIQSNQVPMA